MQLFFHMKSRTKRMRDKQQQDKSITLKLINYTRVMHSNQNYCLR